MIEDCFDLLQCEKSLSWEVRNVSLLGQIALSDKELNHLATLIRQKTSSSFRLGTRFLRRKSPTCLAVFMVWTGVVGYRDGDYWSAVRRAVGLPQGPNWEAKWGRIFLNFLADNDLPRFEIEGSLTFITPILAHGGIPDSCLNEFFEKVLLPMVRRDLADPGDPTDILYELSVRRQDNRERLPLEQRLKQLQSQMNNSKRGVHLVRQVIEAYDEVIQLWELEEAVDRLELPAAEPEDYEALRERELRDRHILMFVIRVLEQRVSPDERLLARLRIMYRSICEDLSVKPQMAELAGEDGQVGARHWTGEHPAQARAKGLRAALMVQYPLLETVESEIRRAQQTGLDKTYFKDNAEELAEQLSKFEVETDRLKQELSFYRVVFPGIDEPIRRYLLYGDKPAEEFLVGSVSMMHQALSSGKISVATEAGVSERVAVAFDLWWTQYIEHESREGDAEDQFDAETGQRFSMPEIFLSPVTADLMVHIRPQRFLAATSSTGVTLEVGSGTEARQIAISVRTYRSSEHLAETEEFTFHIPFPAEQYVFRLKSDNNLIHQWEVAVMKADAPYMAFDWHSTKLIQDGVLPKGRVWLLTHQDFSLEPGVHVIEEGPLYGQWRGYVLRALDLEQVDSLCIVDDQDNRFPVPISAERVPRVSLMGGKRLEDIHTEGTEIYVEPPIQVRIPVEGEDELRMWHVSILPGKNSSLHERKHYRLSELRKVQDTQLDKGWVDVLLTSEHLLGRHAAGTFTIRVRKPPSTDWRCTFCVVQGLEVTFDREVYLPYAAGNASEIQAEISVTEQMEFVPEPPAKLVPRSGNRYTVRIDGSENALRGTLSFQSPDTGRQRIPLTVRIPKMRWRLQGLNDHQYAVWCDTTEELWLGDWETAPEIFLIVDLPSFVDGRLKLGLDGDSAGEQERDIREGKARFDLLAFGDALRAGPSVQTFTLTLPESRFGIEYTPLFKVRTRWEVGDVECVQESEGRTIILRVTWAEKGKTGDKDRIIRLWNAFGTPADPVIERKVWEGTHVTLQASVGELPPGTYLLQFALEEPWSATEVSCPIQDAPNTQVITVVPIGDVRQGEVLSICSIANDRGHLCKLDKGMYKIVIVGKIINRKLPAVVGAEHVLVTRTNEGWYVGNLAVTADPSLKAEIEKANPVKFEYDTSKNQITAIEDRYGDGAMYCRQCCKLYWSQETLKEEKGKGHWLIGPVDVFKIN